MRKPPSLLLLLTLLAGALCAAPARGAAASRPNTVAPGSVPSGISFQGEVAVNGAPVTANSTAKWGVIFRIYNCGPQPGCTDPWGNPEQLLATYPPTGNTAISISAGLFNLEVPVTTATLMGGGQRWLEVELDQPGSTPGLTTPMKPRGQLASVPYALVAKGVEGTIDISSGGLVLTNGTSGNTALSISSVTGDVGIGTSNPYTLLTITSGSLTIDGGGASLHLSSGVMVIDGAGAGLFVQGPVQFGMPGTQASFSAAGTLTLSPAANKLGTQSGGTGQDFSGGPMNDILYLSALGVLSPFPIGPASTILQSNGIIPAWTTLTYPALVAKGGILYGSALNAVASLGIGGAGTLLGSNAASPTWTSVTYPGAVAQGGLLYGSAASTVLSLGIGGNGKILQSVGGVPAWTNASYPGAVAQGDLLYGSAANTLSSLLFNNTATRYLANTGGVSTIPAWDQVDLNTGVKNALPTSIGGTGASLVAPAQGSIPFFSNTNVMTTLAPAAANSVLITNGAANPSWAPGVGSANIGTNLAYGIQGSVPFQRGPGWTQMSTGTASGQLLMSQGANANVTWTTAQYPISTTINQILYSNAANTVTGLATVPNGVLVTNNINGGTPSIATDIPTSVTIGGGNYIYRAGGTKVALLDGGTGANLSGAATGSIIYKAAGILAGSGALTGVLKASAGGAPSALNGTASYNAYWSDANTIAAEQYTATSRGGTGANLSILATNGLIYKTAGALGDTGVLAAGVLKGNGAGVPTHLNGTAGYPAYWLDANTIQAEQYIPMNNGGSGTDLSILATNGLIYKTAGNLGDTGVLAAGVLKGNGAGVPTPLNGTAGYPAYWLDANTIQAEQYIPMNNGGSGTDLSVLATNGLIYKTAGNLGDTGVLAAGVLKGNGAGVPTPMTGTAGYNTYWSDANTIAAEQYRPIAGGGTSLNLPSAATGGLIYKTATNLDGTAALTGVLQGKGANAPTAMNGTSNYNTYWSDANTIAAEQYRPISGGGTGLNLPSAATGGLIYKTATNLDGTAALAGVLQGNGTNPPTAMNGTSAYDTYWSDANTIAAEQYRPISGGGTGSNLPTAATGGLIYKNSGTTLDGTPALTGVLQGNGAGAPTSLNGTTGYSAYWLDANTIQAEHYTSISRGGTGSNLPSAATGGLIYKNSGTTLDGTAALTGVLKGTGAAAPTALNGTAGYSAYWSDANTIQAEQHTAVSRGGTSATLSAVPTGGLVYMGAAGLAGTGALTGALWANGAGAPTVATEDNIPNGMTYQQYKPSNVAITGGTIGTLTTLKLISQSINQLQTLAPGSAGKLYYCNNCSPLKIVVSTGALAGNFADMAGGQFK